MAPAAPGDTPSRRRIFVSQPAGARPRKTRRQADPGRADAAGLSAAGDRRGSQRPLALYRKGRAEGGFDAGIEMALSAVLVSPQFLFRVEQDPAGVRADTPYRVSDLELASRLSFFLWSSIPGRRAAGRGDRRHAARAGGARAAGAPHAGGRALAGARRPISPRSGCTCATSTSITPDMRLFPDFDDNLRQAFRQETELFVDSILREDRSVLDLLRANYTFVNERLAKHYGIPHVYGSRFRRVALDKDSERGGLLRQGSILTVTSYATRTSPVMRGKWILDNLLGVPPPPPLPDVPALKDNTVDGSLTVRKRLAEHRSNATCAGCHNLMDPVGLSLEKFDAVGRRRDGRGRRRRSTPRAAFPTAASSPTSTGSRRRCCAGRSCSSARSPRSC